MKILSLIISFTLLNIGFSQDKEKNFILNSFGLDVGFIGLNLAGNYGDINNFIDGKNIGLIHDESDYFYSNRSASTSLLKFNVGFEIGAKKNRNQELVFNFTYAAGLNMAYFSANNYQNYVIDSIYQYQVSNQNKDTAHSIIVIDSTVYHRQEVAYYASMISIGAQWMFKKDYKRVSYGIAPGVNMGILISSSVYNRYNSYAVVTNANESYPNEEDSYSTWLKGNNGHFIQPTLQASIELKTKNRNNFLDPLSIIAKVNGGMNIVKIKNAPLLTQGMINTSVGLRFEL